MIDARGLSCPTPVLLVQREIKKNTLSSLEVLVDNMTAVGNITRFAASLKYSVKTEELDGEWKLILTK